MAVSGGRLTKRKNLLNAVGVALICAIIASLILMFIPRNTPAVISARQAMVELTSRVISLLSLPGESVDKIYDSAYSYSKLVSENERLQALNQRLEGVEAELQRASLMLARYRELLNMDLGNEVGFVGARIIADMRSPFAKTVLADVGGDKGVRVGMAVMGEKGFIGRVVATGPRTSRVLLVTDLNSHIPIVIGEGQVRAVMSGDNSDQPIIEFLPKAAQVKPDDIVLTSGDGGEIPAGFMVGRIVATKTGFAVDLSQNTNSLTLARIVWTKPPEPPEQTYAFPTNPEN